MLLLFKSKMMTRYLAIAIFALFIFTGNITGQAIKDTLTHPGELSLRIKSISFIKDNEYTTPVIEGYTLVGFFFQPELVYKASRKVALRAGTHMLKYSGTDKFSEIRPVFSTSLNLSEKTLLTIGSLSGSDNHHMFDPHFNSERLYTNYVEDGFQLTSSNDHLFNDTWLSWENFIFKGDKTREIFTVGESFRYTSSTIADKIHFEIPVQLQFKHFGGQISNYPEQVETFFNLATGLRTDFDLSGKRYGQIGIEYLQFMNNQLNGTAQYGVTKGHASWIRFHYTYKALYFGVAYWRSHDFYAPNGNNIYGSVSDYQANVVPDRKIITNDIFLNVLPESYLKLFLGLESYYDVSLKRLDFAISLHLDFDKLFKLADLKH
jgi:hypothetical protein